MPGFAAHTVKWSCYAVVVASMLLVTSCAILRPDEVEDCELKDKYEFLNTEQRLMDEEPVETWENEQVFPADIPEHGVDPRMFDRVTGRQRPVMNRPDQSLTPVTAPPPFYEDFVFLEGDEELPVSLIFNSAPLLDTLPAFADILGFNFVADSTLTGVVTLNLNSVMTRRELWNTFDRMLYLSGAGVTVEDSLLKIMALPKLAREPGARVGQEIYYYALKNSTASQVVTQIQPFMGPNSVCVELTRPNALLVCDDISNMDKVKQLLDIIDQSGRMNWPRLPVLCRNILPTRIVEELQDVLPVLGFTVTQTTDRVELPGAVQLYGIDRLQMVVISAATEEVINEIKLWIDILDSSDSIDQERVFVYKVGHNRASQLVQALTVIYQTQGSSLTVDASSGNDRSTVLSTTNSSSDTSAADRASSVFETPVRVFADDILNRLVIRTTPRTYASIKALLDRLDVVPAQVLLQVLVVEVTLNESTQFGLEFSGKGSGSGVDSLFGTNFTNLNGFGENRQEGFNFLLTNPNNPEDKFGYIRALAGNNAVKVVSSPQLLVSSHTEARIQVGSRVPIITSGISTSASDDRVIQNYTYEDVGIILTITPQITSTNLISLEVEQELSNAVKNTTSSTIDSPELTTRNIQTAMTIANGRTMIIGGLIQEKRNDELQSIPFLNNIPFLRRLLGSTDASVERSEILVLITGYIVNEKSPVEEMIERYNEAINALNQFDETLGDKARPPAGANKLDSWEFWR